MMFNPMSKLAARSAATLLRILPVAMTIIVSMKTTDAATAWIDMPRYLPPLSGPIPSPLQGGRIFIVVKG
jgi:hypothetical protein